jgi:hypothetical protein
MNQQNQSQLLTPQFSIDDIQDNPKLQELTYFYVVHGIIPELMSSVAYRRVDKSVQFKRKEIKCPHCKSRLTYTDEGTNVELYGSVARIKCHIYFQCEICHNEVGIKIAI